ncbi:MAG: DUF3320 domain-containing protein [Nitrospiraceae bacterium]|nr:DUF3320 domain-containing protein [Nitrospiraceae bacterium]
MNNENLQNRGEPENSVQNILIHLDYDKTVNYAMQQNDVPIIKALRIVNHTESPLRDLKLQISTEPSFALRSELNVASIGLGETFNFGTIDLPLSHDYLATLPERVAGSLHVEIFQGEDQISRTTERISVLAFDEWNGLQSIPEILAAFVIPNHPGVESILSDAADILGKWTGESSISGYQSRDPRRITLMAGAIYSSLQQRNIRYVNPPASFEETGQKIRLPERILETRLATCLDLSVLMASCLEQAGLHPLIILTAGHAFPGVWLQEETFPDISTDDLLRLRKRVELNQIMVFETTLLTHDPFIPFDEAVKAGLQHLDKEDSFRCVIDISRARKSRIRPLPIRGEHVSAPVSSTDEPAPSPPVPINIAIPETTSIPDEQTGKQESPQTRLDRWKRKLLDLTLHNRLLNFRDSKKSLPVQCPDLGVLEDALADGISFRIFPKFGDLGEKDARNADIHRNRTGKKSLDEMLREEFNSRRLHADITEGELSRRLLEIYREARLSIEENGANTLYLALGFLSWYETAASSQRRMAPIILIPLEIERRSLQEGFSIKQGDDEPMVNTTLLTHLSADFDLNIIGLDSIPMDEHGINVPLILKKFREAILEIDRWEVLESAYVGHFSFTKFLMWRDLEIRAEDLQRNTIVRHLIYTPTEAYPSEGTFPDPDLLDETHSPEETFCPLSADSSQLAAIYASATGKSFVLHGPPGTGKSQTITNMIAHNLAVGKTVLFVSEKRAALEVVYRRLTDIGLSPFCLELHSNKSHKKEVLTQLEQSLNAQVAHSTDDWLYEAQRLGDIRKSLNAFVKALHMARESGESIHYGLSQLIVQRGKTLVKLELPSVAQVNRLQLAALRDTVRRVQIAGEQVGHPVTNPWMGVECETWSPELRNNLEQVLMEMQQSAQSVLESAEEISAVLGIENDNWSRTDLNNIWTISDILLNCPYLPSALLSADDWEQTKSFILDVAAHGHERNKLREKLYRRYTEAILTVNLDELTHMWSDASKSWVLARWFRFRKVRQKLRGVTQSKYIPQNSEIPADLELALALNREEQFLKGVSARAEELLGNYWLKGEADWNSVESLIERAAALRRVAAEAGGTDIEKNIHFRQKWAKLVSEGSEQLSSGSTLGRRLQGYIEIFGRFRNLESTLVSLLSLNSAAAWGSTDKSGFLQAVMQRCSLWMQSMNSLRAWCHWRSVRSEAINQNISALIHAYEFQGLPATELQGAFSRSYYQGWCDAIIGSEPALRDFFSSDFEDKIRQFKEIDSRYMDLSRREIRAHIAAKIPKGQVDNRNSEAGILRFQLQRQRGHMPVRALFQKIPNLLPRLKPCLLMSPISVAQYLDPAHSPFDLVIFDEASQIPVWDAVGAIARGKEAVIVGDPKQLPPTNFFSRNDSGEDADIDDNLVEDLESILDDCIAAQLPQRYLNWHYRSRHESLIAFSNYHYYDNRLLIFPSPHQELGVSFRHVVGEYDKGKSRTNRAEAEAVVAEVLRRLRDPELSQFSMGIVTFSLPQQVLIDDLLEEARRQKPDIESHFSGEVSEPVFIKNLENVQGDERDVILFSICYGPDSSGRVSMNFGPLNRDGGERRLNVAITRARREVIVFSTILAENIDLSRTRAKGVADLKCFLDYAERGPVAIKERRAADPDADRESPFEDQVFEALEKKGYTVHPQVGCSGYRIDMAVVDPECPGRYLLGIECDGANYHRSKTARDRDKLREGILRGLGWNLHRIWSTDWRENPEKELTRIETAIEAARDQRVSPHKTTEVKTERAPEITDSFSAKKEEREAQIAEEINAPVYELFKMENIKGTPENFYDYRSDQKITALVQSIVRVEGPVTIELATRRVAAHWQMSRVTTRAINRIREISKKANVKVISEGQNVILWGASQDPKTFSQFRVPGTDEISRRNPEEIPSQEIANAAEWILKRHISLPLTELVRETAHLFGYQRTGQSVANVIQSAIGILFRKGVAKEENGMIICQK